MRIQRLVCTVRNAFLEHAVAGPLAVLTLIRRDWLLTDSKWNDSWTQFDTFRHFGELNPWAYETYKSSRVLFVLVGQTLFALFGTYWGQISLAALGLLFLYCSLRFLSRSLLGAAHPLVVGVGLYYPDFHSSAGWMYQNVLGLPLLYFGLGFAIRVSETDGDSPETNNFQWFAQGIVVGSLLYSQYSFVILISGWLLAIFYRLNRRDTVHRLQLLLALRGFVCGLGTAILLHEIIAVFIGSKPFALGRLFYTFISGNSEIVETFTAPISDWIGGASYLAPISLILIAAPITYRRLRKHRVQKQLQIMECLLTFGLFGSALFVVGSSVSISVPKYPWYGVGLVAPLLPLGAIAVVLLGGWSYEFRRCPKFRLEDSLFVGVAWILGWQLARGNIFQSSLLAASGLWLVASVLLVLGARTNRIAHFVLSSTAFLLLGIGTSSAAYRIWECKQREIDFTVIDRVTEFGLSLGSKTTYLFGVDEQISACQPQLMEVVYGAIGEHIHPYSSTDDLSGTVQSRPLSSTVILASSLESAENVIKGAEKQLHRKISITDRTAEVGAGVTVVQIQHEVESLARLRRQLEKSSTHSIEQIMERVISSETYLEASTLYEKSLPHRLGLLLVQGQDVFKTLFPRASVISRQGVGSIRESPTHMTCHPLDSGQFETLLVGPGLAAVSRKQDLEDLKNWVRMCLNETGLNYVELPSNSESPTIFQILSMND